MKNCPFCNSIPVIEQHKEGRFFIQCNSANCAACSGFSDTKKEAEETWNKRTIGKEEEK